MKQYVCGWFNEDGSIGGIEKGEQMTKMALEMIMTNKTNTFVGEIRNITFGDFKNLSLEEATSLMRDGFRVRKNDWPDEKYIEIDKETNCLKYNDGSWYVPDADDFITKIWEIKQ